MQRPPAQGLLCLVMLARLHGVAADADALAHEFAGPDGAVDTAALLRAARALGLKAKASRFKPERLADLALPAIATTRDGGFFLLAKLDLADAGEPARVLIHDPISQRPEVLPWADFLACWSGELVLVTSRASLASELARFDFTWFVPAIVKYRRLLGEVLLAAFFLQLFALITPLFFQVVMDKVLVHKGYTTLTVIGIGLLVVNLFESLLSGLRAWLFAHTSSRIDVELGARLFRHLLALPLSYFEA
ncbi:MAG: type I secretion system permease/ATPase, partial [Rhodocyclaceae bacterium]|nr:type I secretion system permease/ATPase [Rhodocyclaceae bacterium]